MKNINKLAALMLGAVALFTVSCDDDLDNNPVLQSPKTFELNVPAYANANVDLATSEKLHFTWSQPDYGFPAAAKYEMEFSADNNWTVSVEKAAEDKTGNTVPTYARVGDVSPLVSCDVNAADLAKALQQMKLWAKDAVPASQKVFARCMAVYNNDTIYSNVIDFNVLPCYVELKDAAPITYYLVGGCIADGKWTNDASAIGTSLQPLYTVPGTEYDKVTGEGTVQYVGYFPANGEFKIIFTPGDWNNGICGNGTPCGTSLRLGGDDPGNIKVDEAGYYQITVQTKQDVSKVECTIEKYTGSVSVFGAISMAGSFNEWSTTATDLNPLFTFDGAENHDWVIDLSTAGDSEAKFLSDHDWGVNWGTDAFPYGAGVQNGSNIPVKAGNYKVFFNDITGSYYFYSQE